MLELQEPDQIPERQRRAFRVRSENALFDASRYLGDWVGGSEDPIYMESMAFEPFWSKQWNHWKIASAEAKKIEKLEKAEKAAIVDTGADTDVSSSYQKPSSRSLMDTSFDHADGAGGFSAEEKKTMTSTLLHREYLLEPGSAAFRSVLLCLVDILFAACFDYRLTCGEPTVESVRLILVD